MCLATIYTITLNRLLSALYPFRYMGAMTNKKFGIIYFCICVIILSLFGGGLALFWYGGTQGRQWIATQLINFVVFFYFIFCVFTYVRIFMALLHSRRDIQRNVTQQATLTVKTFLWNRMKKQGYVTPLLITFSYLVLVVLPVVGKFVCVVTTDFDWENNCFQVALSVWFIGWNINNVSDAMVYIFFDIDIRRYLKQWKKVRKTRLAHLISIERRQNTQ